jgi:hypothetical protein
MNGSEIKPPSDLPWIDFVLGELECSQCHRRVSTMTLPAGWHEIFTKHPAEQEHPLLICARCLPEFPRYGT